MTTAEGRKATARGTQLLELGRPADAIEVLKKAVALDPEDAHARCKLALALVRSEQFKESLEVADSAAALEPEFEWPQRLRAIAMMGLKRKKQAVDAAEEAVRLAPDLTEPHLVLGQALLLRGDRRGARTAAAKALELDAENGDAHSLMGEVALEDDRPSEAVEHYRAAIAIDPEDAVSLNNLGLALLRLDRESEAHEAFESAARLDPRLDVPRQNLQASARSWVNGAVAVFVLWFLGFRAISLLTRGEVGAGAVFALLFALALAFFVSQARKRRAQLSPATQRLLAEQSWWERLEIKNWRPWPLLVPSPIYFVLGFAFLVALIAQGAREDRLAESGFLAVLAAVTAFVAFTAWRGRLYLRRKGWWPGTG